jgi:uncharacterized protein
MQQRNEKSAEPSMEDILASIRKIIAEEPAPAKASSAARPPVTAAAATVPPAPLKAPPAIAPRPSTPAPPPVAQAPAAVVPSPTPPAPAAPSRLSDIMRELAPSAVPVGSLASSTFHDDLADLVEGDPEPAPAPSRAAEAPVSAALPAKEPAPAKATAPELAPLRFELPLRATAEEPSEPRAKANGNDTFGNLGALVPQAADSLRASAPRPLPLSVGADMRTPEPSRPLPSLPPLEPQGDRPVLADLATEAAESAPDLISPPGDHVDAAQSALGALAMGLAAPTSVAVSRESAFGAEMATASGRRTLDDTIVDMLRPMVREWLDAHLPEMVETALRQEMADAMKRDS